MNKLNRLAATVTLAVVGLLASFGSHAANVPVNVSGANSVNLLGETGNTVWLVNIGANALLSSLDWAVTLNAFAPSQLAEMQVSFSNSSGLDQITLSPGAGADFSGTSSYTGSLDTTPFAITSGADGLLRIEFSEAFKDAGFGTAEGQWLSGNLTLGVSAVPEPASAVLALLGLAAVGLRVRRPGCRFTPVP